MKNLRTISLLVLVVAVAFETKESAAQQTPKVSTKIVDATTPDLIRAIQESRQVASHEVFEDYARIAPPHIAYSLIDRSTVIAYVSVTSVKLPETQDQRTIVKLHVGQFLRGGSEATDLETTSRWRPPGREFMIVSGPRFTVLETREPRVGNHYLVGYHPLQGEVNRVQVNDAIDLSDSTQVANIAEVERFIGLDTTTGDSYGSFLPLLKYNRWIRSVAVWRLAASADCSATTDCAGALLSAVQEMLNSKRLGERWEALQWVSRIVHGPSRRSESLLVSNGRLRGLLTEATADSNAFIGDEAFTMLSFFDLFTNGRSGDCVEVAPPLRKTARWSYTESRGLMFGGPLGNRITCITPPPDSEQP